MKKQHLPLLVALLALAVTLNAQTPGFNYQAVIRDASGAAIDASGVSVRVRLYKDAANGSVAFEEIHDSVPVLKGLVNLKIGGVNPAGLAVIDWGAATYFIAVDYDLNNGQNFTNTAAVQVLAVPLAEWARSSGDWVNVGDTAVHSVPNVNVGIGVNTPQHRLSVDKTAAFGNRIFPGVNGTEGGYSLIHFKNGTSQKGGIIRASIGDHDGSDAPLSYEASSHSFLGPVSIHNRFPSLTFKSTTTQKALYWEMHEAALLYLFDPQLQKYRISFADNGVGIFTNNPQYTLDVNGSAAANCLTIKGGCDIIENTNSTETLYPGEVIVIDPERPNHVLRSNKAYDRMTIGVISGAGGVTHGMMLSQEGVLDGNVSFAIAGRVKVKVTGKVQPGDLLTTSNVPGHAMTAQNRRKRDGTVIGKALSAPDGEGLVLMLVMMK